MKIKSPVKKILIPNRGEIAVRVQRTCREMNIPTVAVYSDPDRFALHVRYADEAYSLSGKSPQETYLNQDKILAIARKSGANAIHPGYGFLSENTEFVKRCQQEGLIFIGPGPEAIEMMGFKTAARQCMMDAGVPVVPGTESISDFSEAKKMGEEIGYPVLIKAAAGGGGKGMRLVEKEQDLNPALEACSREAESAFADPRIYMEKYLCQPRHIEFQILADLHGQVIHLFERECSIQRRHQKIIEETPSPIVDQELRKKMGEVAIKAAQACNYTNAGTVEFLVDEQKNFYFLEMNTRLQVEHPITEMITGVDIVRQQIRIAQEESLQTTFSRRGAALECRIYAENPEKNFLPSPGDIKRLTNPAGPGVRNDSGVYSGYRIPMEYDPMISKLIVWGENREQARLRMLRALEEYHILGIKTNISYLRQILCHRQFIKGEYDTHFINDYQDQLFAKSKSDEESVALAAAAIISMTSNRKKRTGTQDHCSVSPWKRSGWRYEGGE